MDYRMLRICGFTSAGRRRRVERVARWMWHRGWKLVDYSELTRQAMFAPHQETARSLLPWQAPPGQWIGLLVEWGTSWRLIPLAALGAAIGWLFFFNPTLIEFDPQPTAQEELARWRQVTVDTLNVREAPVIGSQIVGMVYKGQRVLIGQDLDGWVELVEPQRGFVSSRYLERMDPEAATVSEEQGEE